MNTILEAKNITKIYNRHTKNEFEALRGISLEVHEGDFICIMGPSGSGKSTLINNLSTIDMPTKGKVKINGVDVYSMLESQTGKFRYENLGFIFQSFNLISSLNVWENIVLPIGLDGRNVNEAFVNEILCTLGIEEKKHNLPNTLSGGQQQRVAIARAIASKPDIILADEPTGNLDTKTGDEVISLLKMTARKYGQTLVMITHDEEIAQMADRIILIEDGKVVD